MEIVLEAGAEDIQSDFEEYIIYSGAADLSAVANALRQAGMAPSSQQLVSVPQNPSMIDEVKAAKQALRLYEVLDDYEDTMNVFTNFEISYEVLSQLDV